MRSLLVVTALLVTGCGKEIGDSCIISSDCDAHIRHSTDSWVAASASTLFSALTGAQVKVGNYPGVTVDRRMGRARLASSVALPVIIGPSNFLPHASR